MLQSQSDEAERESLDRYSAWLRSSHSGSEVGQNASLGVTDLFCGPGGFSYGFKSGLASAGVLAHSQLAVDFDSAAIETYRQNNDPLVVRKADMGELFSGALQDVEKQLLGGRMPRVVDKRLLASVKRSDFVLASPPCRGFSNFNNVSRRNDERNELSIAAAALAIAGGAKFYLMENVPEIRADKSGILERTVEAFKAHGYSVDYCVLNAMDFGIPQTRRRLFLLASRGYEATMVLEDLQRQKASPPGTADVLALPYGGKSESPHMIAETQLSTENKLRIDHLFDNECYDLPHEVRPECHKEDHTYPSVYGRLRPDQPSGTLTSGFLSPGRGRYVHPSERRGLNLRDGARLQSFPDQYVFPEDRGRTIIARLIGDAVPPLMSFAFGRCVAQRFRRS